MLLLNTKYTKKLTLSELLIVNKSDLLTECDPRLKSFIFKICNREKEIQVKKWWRVTIVKYFWEYIEGKEL